MTARTLATAALAACAILLPGLAPAQEDTHTTGVDISDLDPASADLFVENDSSLSGFVCLGFACTDDEDFAGIEVVKIDDHIPWIDFVDTSGTPDPFRDCRLRVNDRTYPGIDRFSVEDLDAGTIPFTIEGAAPANALYVSAGGQTGLGTSLPSANLHIVDGSTAEVRLERDTSEAWPLQTWELFNNGTGMGFYDETGFRIPFFVENAAPNYSLLVTTSGNVGIGTEAPAAPLEIVAQNDTFSFFRITAFNAPVNKSVDIVFTKGPANTGQLRYNIVDGDGPEMTLDADGNMVLTGTLTTAGPSCSGGCDRVFAPDYALASIEDHAAAMWAAGYLPAVGPTAPGAPVNVTEKMGGMLNELEHAHLYIAELQARLRAQEDAEAALRAQVSQQDALLAEMAARLRALETAADR